MSGYGWVAIFMSTISLFVATACTSESPPAAVPDTPAPTATSYYPTATPYPTHTPSPAATPTRLLPSPVPTLAPIDTPVPTPTPTPTPEPTATSEPSFSESWNIPPDRILTVADLVATQVIWKDKLPIMLVGCYAGVSGAGQTWRKFSYNGQFGEEHYLAGVSGFGETPIEDECYEMVVEYWLEEDYCYSISYFNIRPFPFSCNGWEQTTPEFYIVDTGAVQKLSLHELRQKYADHQP